MKKCPFCAEKIQNEAQICRYCGRELPNSSEDTSVIGGKKKKTQLVGLCSIIFIALVAIVIFFLFINKPDDVYSENFNNPSALTDWDVKTKDQNGSVIAQNGGYYLKVENGSLGSFLRGKNFGDTVLTIDMEFLTSEPAIVSIICRNGVSGYGFGISNDGQWTFDKSGKLLGSGETKALKDGVNKIKVACEGQQFTLEINDELVGSASDPEFSLGEIGLGLSSSGNAEVVFDNLKIAGTCTQAAEPDDKKEAVQEVESQASEMPTETPTLQVTSTPTITPTIVPTLRPTPIPTDQLLIYQTDFEDNDASLINWKTFAYSSVQKSISTEGYEAFASTGLYRFKATEKNQRIFSIYNDDLGTSDVDLSLNKVAQYGLLNTGLVCRYSPSGWYQYVVEPNDRWSIWMAKADEAGQMHFYQLGEGGYFYFSRFMNIELRMECKGDRITIYANGTKLSSIHDDTFQTGKVGITGWSFTEPGTVTMIDNFTAQRAQWSESTVEGPAPTPSTDGTIYKTQFDYHEDLSKLFFTFSPWNGFGYSPLYYINDFDPGTGDVEISASFQQEKNMRGLVCRYSEDGWYEVHYDNRWININRVERTLDGIYHRIEFVSTGDASDDNSTITLTCSGNRISVALDGQSIFSREDNVFSTGRYGFFVENTDPAIPLERIFASYNVRVADASQTSNDKITTVSKDPPDFVWNWGLNIYTDSRVKTEENTVVLVPGDTPLHLFNGTPVENSELTVDLEFLSESTINLRCRTGSPAESAFIISSDGTWEMTAPGKGTGKQISTSIQANKNQFVLRCINNTVTFIANGEIIKIDELSSYSPASGNTGFDVIEGNTQVKINRLAMTAENMPIVSSPSESQLPNQVVLASFIPGVEIYRTDFSDLGELAYFSNRNLVFPMDKLEIPGYTYIQDLMWPGRDPNWKSSGMFLTNKLKIVYQLDMSDMPIEVSAETTFSEDVPGPMFLVCRYNVLGWYEFDIQPNGKWDIKRQEPDRDSRTGASVILVEGVSTTILPNRNQMSATCQNNELIFSVNGTELGRVQDDEYVGGKVGFGVGPDSTGYFTSFSILMK